jgi:hypothetical protein
VKQYLDAFMYAISSVVEGVLNMPHPLGIEIGHDNLLQTQ